MKKLYMFVTLFCLLATCGTIFAGCNEGARYGYERPYRPDRGEPGYEKPSSM